MSNRRMDKEDVVYIYTMEYYSAIEKNEILTITMKWMEVECYAKRSKSEKDVKHMISLM